jgi:molybdopterin converting factor small subunit
MQVEIRLFAGLREGRFKKQPGTPMPDGARLADVLRLLGIADEEVCLPLVNGRYSSLDCALHEGDVVSLFPAAGGG